MLILGGTRGLLYSWRRAIHSSCFLVSYQSILCEKGGDLERLVHAPSWTTMNCSPSSTSQSRLRTPDWQVTQNTPLIELEQPLLVRQCPVSWDEFPHL